MMATRFKAYKNIIVELVKNNDQQLHCYNNLTSSDLNVDRGQDLNLISSLLFTGSTTNGKGIAIKVTSS